MLIRLKYCCGEEVQHCTNWWRTVSFDVLGINILNIEFLELTWAVEPNVLEAHAFYGVEYWNF
jgi:hypothetical protein